MPPIILLTFLLCYFIFIYGISFFLSRKQKGNASFFAANKSSKWYIIAIGMIGTTLSGITFISIPGKVNSDNFSYLGFIIGNMFGFLIIIFWLLPLYYRYNLTSIYSYIGIRFNKKIQKLAAVLFFFARTVACAGKLYLVLFILQEFIFKELEIPFIISCLICLFFIWLYTFKGGLHTIIWTDLLQTFFLLLAIVLSFFYITQALDFDLFETFRFIKNDPRSQVFFWDNFSVNQKHFVKQFIGGIGICIAAVGFDQDIMQKNLSLPKIKDAQKDMLVFITIFFLINICFLSIGVLLYQYCEKYNIGFPAASDHLYPMIALQYLPMGATIFFMLGLTAATFATTDSSLTALTTSFCIDILEFDRKKQTIPSENLIKKRFFVHIGFTFVTLLVCLLLYSYNEEAMVITIFKLAGYTYGPLLGLFLFGLFMRAQISTRDTLIITAMSPLLTYLLQYFLKEHHIYYFGYELIFLNGSITFLGLWLLRSRIGQPA